MAYRIEVLDPLCPKTGTVPSHIELCSQLETNDGGKTFRSYAELTLCVPCADPLATPVSAAGLREFAAAFISTAEALEREQARQGFVLIRKGGLIVSDSMKDSAQSAESRPFHHDGGGPRSCEPVAQSPVSIAITTENVDAWFREAGPGGPVRLNASREQMRNAAIADVNANLARVLQPSAPSPGLTDSIEWLKDQQRKHWWIEPNYAEVIGREMGRLRTAEATLRAENERL